MYTSSRDNIIIKAASYCDHCKGHTSSSSSDIRLPTSVVGIKDNPQSGVGINDNLQQQSPSLSLMTTTHAPPKRMLHLNLSPPLASMAKSNLNYISS